MALPTTDTPTTVATMGPSPTSAGVKQSPDTMPAAPVLFDDIDPVLLMRLYPGITDAQAAALAAAQADYDGAKTLVAAQQVEMAPPAPPVATTTPTC